ncbi:MAG: hypothetical protein JWL79_2971 [Frankiales bacterium]|nr:hypothetical protein [Frankiales bacterium]
MRAVRLVLAAASALAMLLGLPTLAQPTSTGSGAAPARVSFDPVTGRVGQLADYVHRGLSREQAMLVRQLDRLVAGGVPRAAIGYRLTATPPLVCVRAGSGVFQSGYSSTLVAGGDMSGDGRPDVIENHYIALTDKTTAWVLNLRDARTGHVWWRRSAVLNNSSIAFGFPLQAGPGQVRVLVLHLSITVDSVGVRDRSTVRYDLELARGTGRTSWRRVFVGHGESVAFVSDSETDVPYIIDVARLRPGVEDVLVAFYSGDDKSGYAGRLMGIAGDSGRTRTLVPTVHGTRTLPDLPAGLDVSLLAVQQVPQFGVVPDQNGDRRDDVYSAVLGLQPVLTTYRGDTGRAIWRTLILPPTQSLLVIDAGVLTSTERHLHDLAVIVDGTGGVDVLGTGTDVTTSNVALVTGGTGDLAWMLPGSMAYPTGRYGAQHVPVLAVGFTTTVTSGLSSTITYRFHDVQADGVALDTHSYSVTVASPVCGFSFIALDTSNDFDGDGQVDPRLVGYAYLDLTGDGRYPLVLRGANGQELDRSSAEPLYGSVDGHGDDRVLLTHHTSAWRFDVVRGDTLARLWSRSVSVPNKGITGAYAYAVEGVSARCADVWATAYWASGEVDALVAGNGQPWWTVTYGKKDTVGVLKRGVSAHPRC